MRQIFITIFMIAALAAPSLSAAESAFKCEHGKLIAQSQAADLVSKAQAAYSKLTSFNADFKQASYLATLDTSEESSGVMWFRKPGQMRWNYSAPEEQQFLLKDQTIWFYQKADNQVLIDNFKKVLLQDVPVSFLMGVGTLSDNFEIARACHSNVGIVLDLTPKRAQAGNGEDALKSLKLLIDRDGFLPLGAEVRDSAQNLTSITFSRRKLNESFGQELFAAKFPKDADLIDRRKDS